jgi:hypothetical protein
MRISAGGAGMAMVWAQTGFWDYSVHNAEDFTDVNEEIDHRD